MSQTSRYEELRKELDPELLIQRARKEAGLSDFGGEGFMEPYKKVLDCAAREVDFHAQGLEAFKSNVVRSLVNRLRLQNDLRLHPEILDEDVSNPIVIFGLPRSGTTKMQRMMSAAPNVQKTLLWKLLNPAPFPNAMAGKPDPRIAAAGMGDTLSSDEQPDFAAAHVSTGGEAEEDSVLFDLTFNDWVWSIVHSPSLSYYEWVKARPALGNYEYERTLLQYLQWQDGGKRGRPWILKTPLHTPHLEAILKVFPKATLIQCHRDPRTCIASMAKFQMVIWGMRVDNIDPKFAGQVTLRWFAYAMDRCLEARDKLQLNDRILDVPYDLVRAGPISAIREAYRRAGLAMTADAEQQMLKWEKDNEQHQFGKYKYSLEEFGLTDETVDKAFEEYIRRFINRK